MGDVTARKALPSAVGNIWCNAKRDMVATKLTRSHCSRASRHLQTNVAGAHKIPRRHKLLILVGQGGHGIKTKVIELSQDHAAAL